jgi:hypothetical protein
VKITFGYFKDMECCWVVDILAESSTGHQRNGMYDITGFSALVFSCDAGNSAGFAKDIETTISGISSILIKTVKLARRYC